MKKLIKALAVACVISLVPMTAFAANSATSVKNSSSSHLVGGGSGSGSSVAAGSTTTSATGTTVVIGNQVRTVLGSTSDGSGNLTSGLVSGTGASAATGAAKRAGLPANVVAMLDGIDNGSLAGVAPASGTVANKAVLAGTVAVTNAAGKQLQLIMAKSKIPASGVVEVLFYNNTNNTTVVLPATVDRATGIVTFTAPADGTAAVIG